MKRDQDLNFFCYKLWRYATQFTVLTNGIFVSSHSTWFGFPVCLILPAAFPGSALPLLLWVLSFFSAAPTETVNPNSHKSRGYLDLELNSMAQRHLLKMGTQTSFPSSKKILTVLWVLWHQGLKEQFFMFQWNVEGFQYMWKISYFFHLIAEPWILWV